MNEAQRLGRYRLLHRIGSGGMGEVHRARAYGAEGVVKDLCIKRMRRERLSAPGTRDAFVREARLSARLAHPNIVPVFDFGRCEDEYYLAMEWIDGHDLSTLLAEGGELDEYVIAHVAAEVARALAYAHEAAPDAPIVHRDVKPANVLVSRTGDVRLGDFGVASWIGVPEGVAGTRAYMAPEAVLGRAGTESDVYSLGRLIERGRDDAAANDDLLGTIASELVNEDPGLRPSAAEAAARLEAFVAGFVSRGARPPREQLAARVAEVVREPPGSRLEDRPLSDAESFLHAPEPTATTAAPAPPASAVRRRGGFTALAVLGGGMALAFAAAAGWRVGDGSVAVPLTPKLSEPTLEAAVTAAPAAVAAEAPPVPAPSRAEAADPPPEPVTAVSPRRRQRAPMRRPAPTVDPTPIAEPATLSINAIPWARVSIDGQPRGTTPLMGITITPSTSHTVVFDNDVLGAHVQRDVRLDPGASDRLIVDLREL